VEAPATGKGGAGAGRKRASSVALAIVGSAVSAAVRRHASLREWYRGRVTVDARSFMEHLSHKERLQLLRFVCSFVWADLEVTEKERAFVHKMVRKLDLRESEAREVEGWLELPPSPDSVDPGTISPRHREIFLEAVREAAAADGALSEAEREDLALFERLLR
jgi:uncharacterized tellurite resistance protein B-like protein